MRKQDKGGFEDLIVWQAAREYRNQIRSLIKVFPPDEKFRLSDQIIRSSRSVTANIAEGHGKFHYQENIRSCRLARGSLSETLDHLICAFDEQYIDALKLKEFRNDFDRILRLLNGYIYFLKEKKKEGDD